MEIETLHKVIAEQSAELHEQDKTIEAFRITIIILCGIIIMFGLIIYYKTF